MAKKKTAAKKQPTDPKPLVITEEASKALATASTFDANLRVMADNEWRDAKDQIATLERRVDDVMLVLDVTLDRLSRAEKTLLEIAERIGPLAIIVDRLADRVLKIETQWATVDDPGQTVARMFRKYLAQQDKAE